MQATAKLTQARISAQKCRLVADQVRGLPVERGSAEAVRLGRWKAIRSPMQTGSLRLYDLEQDLGESTDLAGRAEHAGLVARLAALMDEAHVPSPDFRTPAERKARGR